MSGVDGVGFFAFDPVVEVFLSVMEFDDLVDRQGFLLDWVDADLALQRDVEELVPVVIP